jgi:hypothetical protein
MLFEEVARDWRTLDLIAKRETLETEFQAIRQRKMAPAGLELASLHTRSPHRRDQRGMQAFRERQKIASGLNISGNS